MRTLKKHQYFVLTIVTFIGIVLYELNINPAQLLTQLFADSQSFAILVKDDEFVLLDQKTRFIINQDETERQFIFLNHDTGMINGVFDIHSINELTVIRGHRGTEMGLKRNLPRWLRGGSLIAIALIATLALAACGTETEIVTVEKEVVGEQEVIKEVVVVKEERDPGRCR